MWFLKERVMETIAVGSRDIIILASKPAVPLWRYFVSVGTAYGVIVIILHPSTLVRVYIKQNIRTASKSS
jgi:hypothetical protein